MHASIPPLSLFAPLTLPNGAVVPNRIAKAAMEENMADGGQLPGENLRRLYASWAGGGVGLILSGNVMIDPAALTGPGGVVLDERQPIEPFRAWARAAKSGGRQGGRGGGVAADQPPWPAGFRRNGTGGCGAVRRRPQHGGILASVSRATPAG